MVRHVTLGENENERGRRLFRLIKNHCVTFGGYEKGKVYGILNCKSGKRIKLENRVFFRDENEALEAGYRPCGHCLPAKYKIWKAGKLVSDENKSSK